MGGKKKYIEMFGSFMESFNCCFSPQKNILQVRQTPVIYNTDIYILCNITLSA